MKKIYVRPEAEVACTFAELMELPLNSVGLSGKVTGEEDTNWQFESDGKSTDNPDAKDNSNLWDGWDD